jgi:hypothetical protein
MSYYTPNARIMLLQPWEKMSVSGKMNVMKLHNRVRKGTSKERSMT